MATPAKLASTTDLTIWTGYQEQFNASGTLTGWTIDYYHAPVLGFLPIFLTAMIVIFYVIDLLRKTLKKYA